MGPDEQLEKLAPWVMVIDEITLSVEQKLHIAVDALRHETDHERRIVEDHTSDDGTGLITERVCRPVPLPSAIRLGATVLDAASKLV